MSYRTLNIRRDGPVLRVDFDNAPLNLMTVTMVGELFDLAGKLIFDEDTSVVVFGSANPDFFIAHFDLDDMYRAMEDPNVPQSNYPDIHGLQALTTMWEALPQVTISQVDGICRGGGLEFLLATHMRFATPQSNFCFPETSGRFLPTGGGTTRLALQVGASRAREVLLSARDFSGDEAASYGILNRCIAKAEIASYVDDLAHRIAARSTASIAALGEVLRRVNDSALDAQFAGFAVENSAMARLLSIPSVHDHLMKITGWQDAEHELDLPATIEQAAAAAAH